MKKSVLLLVMCGFLFLAAAQKTNDVVVDKNGVLRWGNSKEEVKGFGINYTVPFAHAYRTAKRMGIDIEKAIDDDVYHFARLGFDLYRVHVWDTEISDTLGNLLINENLRLFDYMVKKMKERGMKFIITPIAFWGNGWPEPDEPTPGFARKYGKDACLTHPEAIKAQENYLFQFLNHVNTYTGIAYKNDPDIIAFEVSNEPHHREAPEKVTVFIDRMVTAMKRTGCKKPILYNITHSIHLADAYFKSGIQGGTFQWYPTGLGARHELGGNLLPHVDQYVVPFANHPKYKSMAKIVYEFDAADVGRSYIYPAMARSFREAGMQLATHFSYDPTYMAYANTEYGTHYMNLVYTPQKALSLMLAAEVFRRVPMNKSFGRYPQNVSFDAFRISYENDLAELITEKQFIYTNSTTSTVPAAKLEQLAGSGNSHLIQYGGTGAYFLDRLQEGVWRLEVMPDAVWVRDPFERTSLKKEVSVIHWGNWPMVVNLPDLGESFSVDGLNTGNSFSAQATGGRIEVKPGTYLLTRKGVVTNLSASFKWKKITLGEFTAPASTVKKTVVVHKPAPELSAGKPYAVTATIISPTEPEEVELHVWAGFRPVVLKMERQHGYVYSATIPSENIIPGFLRYYITVKEKAKSFTFPAGVQTHPNDWDFYVADEAYRVPVVPQGAPLYLFHAATDTDQLLRPWLRTSSLVPTGEPGKAELTVNVERLFMEDPENKYKEKIYDYSMRYFFGKKLEGRKAELAGITRLVFTGRSLNDKPCIIQLALITKDGSAYGHTLALLPDRKEYSIALTALQKAKLVTLPRPYPTFLSYYFENQQSGSLNLDELESIQVSIGPGIPERELNDKHGMAVESIRLER
jgi:hypothetical protein